jgi:ethanolamine utilization protein EutM
MGFRGDDAGRRVASSEERGASMAEAAIGMVETKGYTGAIEATDGMAKAANVSIARSIAIGGGLITVICRGDVASVKAAVDAGSKAAARVGELLASHVIARPHEELARGFLADAAVKK